MQFLGTPERVYALIKDYDARWHSNFTYKSALARLYLLTFTLCQTGGEMWRHGGMHDEYKWLLGCMILKKMK